MKALSDDSLPSFRLGSQGNLAAVPTKGPSPRFELAPIVNELQQQIISADCQSDVIAMLGASGRLVLRDTMQDGPPLVTSVRNPYRVFMSPDGNHTLVSTTDGELCYFSVRNRKSTGHFTLHNRGASGNEAARNNVASCVCWLSSDAGFIGSPRTSISGAEGVSGSGSGWQLGSGTVYCLVGTKLGGLVFLVKVEVHGDGGSVKLTCFRSLQLPDANPQQQVGSVEVEHINSLWVLFVSTPTVLYRVEGLMDSPADFFDSITASTGMWNIRRVSTAGNASASGAVVLYRPGIGMPAQSYAWASVAGVVHGLLNSRSDGSSANSGEAALVELTDGGSVVNEQLLDLEHVVVPKSSSNESAAITAAVPDHSFRGESQLPVGATLVDVGLTAFHMLLLYRDRFIVLNHPAGLSWRGASSTLQGDWPYLCEIEERIRFDPFRYSKRESPLRGIVRDTAARKVYVFDANTFWELQVEQEHRQQSELFLDRAVNTRESSHLRNRYFRAAYQLCKYDKTMRNKVQFLRGRFLLQIGAIRRAMDVLAECDFFEDVYHLLMSFRNSKVLQLYVEKRYKNLVRRVTEGKGVQMQLACLLALIVVLRLDTIARSENITDAPSATAVAETLTSGLTAFIEETLEERLPMFSCVGYVNLIAQLLEEQSRPELVLRFAERMNKMRYVITYHVSRANYVEAANVLGAHARRMDLRSTWYSLAPILMKKCPIQFTKAMLRAVSRDAYDMPYLLLNAEKLIPVFTQYEPHMNEDPDNQEHQVVLFLDNCITKLGCDSPAVHNYYLSLVVKHDTKRLDEFLQSSLYYDIGFALRQCLESRRYRQCVRLYSQLHLYEDALRAALDCAELTQNETPGGASSAIVGSGVNECAATSLVSGADLGCNEGEERDAWSRLSVAQELLLSLPDDMPLPRRKALWLIVAQHVIQKNDNRAALRILADSCGVLKLEDILEEMNDVSVMENFKGAICKSLEVYASLTKQLREKQLEAGRMSEELKREIEQPRNSFGYVTANQRCIICRSTLLQGDAPFFIYPRCCHAVHESCAVAKLESIGGLEAFVVDEGLPKNFLDGINSTRDLAQMDCVICGETAILEIDMPLFTEDDSWLVL
ncbi:hypothetical protein, conserved [Trypanosoma brucei gambiense DAL972]|uniref:Pep3/Vps18 beta-propeller domain-containing protein n=1 Tax=Trypanosoma brucei gambiense (strain MHOM/CI/86/DAL972) TaxID=679716 RepID=D0A5Q6_TRYB9|nr:hypothetical protein, conserved [Trypanosoma brucei gambiense DAL972]CBH17007.1 hypothetical protein, conserved [Trypanosoma brucei gambiense DAL972]|eukprot:XP_011779271.1 hypothetical protein, conserved [Trypanosoma brucei gambiense DAL972]